MSVVKTYYYKVAGLTFELELQEDDLLNNVLKPYRPFQVDAQADDVIFHLSVHPFGTLLPDKIQKTPIADFDEEGQRMVLYKSEGKPDYDIRMILDSEPNGYCMLSIHHQFTFAELFTVGNVNMRSFGLNNAMMMMFAFASASRDTILLHASVIKKEGYGYLFLGKSGTGKSTHSSLWLKYIEGTELLNDDNPAIRIVDGVPMVFGTPWSGKTACYKNDSVPVGGFLRLWQAPYNKIENLTLVKAYAALLPTISCMKWESILANGVNQTLEAIIKTTPVFKLECLPDEAAARMSCAALIQKKERHIIKLPNEILLGEVRTLVKEGHSVTLRVKGNSMLPFIIGGRDSVRLVCRDSYHVGDIVLAENIPNHFVLHRIISINGNSPESEVVLMGDGNLKRTEHCKVKNLIAVADSIIQNEKVINPYSTSQKLKAYWWRKSCFARRWLMAILRRTILKKKIISLDQQ